MIDIKAKFQDVHIRMEMLAGPPLTYRHWAFEIIVPFEDLESLKSAKAVKDMLRSNFHYLTEKILHAVAVTRLQK